MVVQGKIASLGSDRFKTIPIQKLLMLGRRRSTAEPDSRQPVVDISAHGMRRRENNAPLIRQKHFERRQNRLRIFDMLDKCQHGDHIHLQAQPAMQRSQALWNHHILAHKHFKPGSIRRLNPIHAEITAISRQELLQKSRPASNIQHRRTRLNKRRRLPQTPGTQPRRKQSFSFLVFNRQIAGSQTHINR